MVLTKEILHIGLNYLEKGIINTLKGWKQITRAENGRYIELQCKK